MIFRYFAGTVGCEKDVMNEFHTTNVESIGDVLQVQFRPVRTLNKCEDLLSLNDCRWVPLRWLWPTSWFIGLVYSIFVLIQQYTAGNYLTMTPPGAMIGVLLVWAQGVVQRALYGSLYHPGGFIQPESREEAALFKTCRTLTLNEYAAYWIQQFKKLPQGEEEKEELETEAAKR